MPGAQMLERETDIARMQATQAYGVQTDRNKTAADLQSSLAGRDAIAAQLIDANKQVSALDADESQLHQLGTKPSHTGRQLPGGFENSG